MANDWTRDEVEAAVADYFSMLNDERRGRVYSKTAHRRLLKSLLNDRSDAAIERKHGNISAVLLKELGFVSIDGYKPLGNYQQLLAEVVEARLESETELVELVRTEVTEPAVVPSVEDILGVLEEPPTPREKHDRYQRAAIARDRRVPRLGVNYLEIESHNRSLGAAGEDFVFQFEVARLCHAGKEQLANQVEWVSATQGDGLGYDILSFDITGRERFIEVKTTSYGKYTPFFATRNEISFSSKFSEAFHLYRAFNFRRRPALYEKQGPLEQSFHLEPSTFVATVD